MKKYLFGLLALVLGIGMLKAGPVDASRAKMVGQQFVQATWQAGDEELNLVYAPVSENGVPSFYVFNVGQEGFVIVSGDDFYRPIIGYSNESVFDLSNPALAYYLRTIQGGRDHRVTGEAEPAVAAEWENILVNGATASKNGGRAASFLCTTKWNQNFPYNYLCPEFAGGDGGHFYAGCVATAMAQVMKYWDHPLQGQGSHEYTSQAHPYTANHPVNVPSQHCSADFGNTTYDWDNMPEKITSGSPMAQIMAIATLTYHCAVSVNMDWDYDGSGTQSTIVPGAISNYFRYSNASVFRYRENYSADNWKHMVRESIDMSWPVYYSGYEIQENGQLGGHAFVLDGYDDNDLYHFNYGWGGTGNGWFTFDNQEFHLQDGAIFNFVPVDVYNSAPMAPTNLSVVPTSDTDLSATLTWTNPTKTLNNTNLTSIERVEIRRDGQLVAVIDNPAPGASMTYVDNDVPRYDIFEYSVYAVANGQHGKNVYSPLVNFGPTCKWTVMMASSVAQGWRGGYISVFNASGKLLTTLTTNTSSPSSQQINVPVGRISFSWTAPENNIPSMTLIIKNAKGNTVYNYAGASNDFASGVFYIGNNGCQNEVGTGVPSNMLAVRDEENPDYINVSWDGVPDPGYGYNVYRDGLLYRTITSGTSFVDNYVTQGGHCYYATCLTYGGESEGTSNESCATAGTGCEPPRDLYYEYTGSSFKPKLMWSRPAVSDGLSGYMIYRKKPGETEYKLVKINSSSSTYYTDNSANQEGWYSYRVVAYYQSIDCYSAPANYMYDSNKFCLDVYWSATDVEENLTGEVNIYPNPTNHRFTVEADNLQQVAVYNTLGQLVISKVCSGNNAEIDLGDVETGIYMVKIFAANSETVRKVSVIR